MMDIYIIDMECIQNTECDKLSITDRDDTRVYIDDIPEESHNIPFVLLYAYLHRTLSPIARFDRHNDIRIDIEIIDNSASFDTVISYVLPLYPTLYRDIYRNDDGTYRVIEIITPKGYVTVSFSTGINDRYRIDVSLLVLQSANYIKSYIDDVIDRKSSSIASRSIIIGVLPDYDTDSIPKYDIPDGIRAVVSLYEDYFMSDVLRTVLDM